MPTKAIDRLIKKIEEQTRRYVRLLREDAKIVAEEAVILMNRRIEKSIDEKRSPDRIWNFAQYKIPDLTGYQGKKFKPLTQAWQKRKIANKDKILVHTKYHILRHTRIRVEGNRVIFRFRNQIKSFVHQHGSNNVPARPYIGINKEDALRLEAQLEKAVKENLGKAFNG